MRKVGGLRPGWTLPRLGGLSGLYPQHPAPRRRGRRDDGGAGFREGERRPGRYNPGMAEATGMLLLHWLTAVILLPGTVVVLVPWGILSLAAEGEGLRASLAHPVSWFALLAGLCGLLLALWTLSLFIRFGKGTAAPWDPPRSLVVRGPYLHVRNPMITGVFLMLVCESVVFQSWGLAAWTAVFALGNLVYIPRFEEAGLAKRFGEDYLAYKRGVPRWVPRLTAWRPEEKRPDDSR